MFTPFATNLAQGKGALPLPFSTGCRVCWSVTGSTFVTFVSAPVCHFVHFVRSIASRFRSIGNPLQQAPAPPAETGRPFVRVGRAARDLAYFFHRLPFKRIAWAIPYLPAN